MKRVLLVLAICLLLASLGWISWVTFQNPKATIRIVDEVGNPVEGAVINPDGVRGADGGHYGWRDDFRVEARSIKTDHNGLARVEYPRFVK